MEQKTEQLIRVLCATVTTTLNRIKADAGSIPEELYAEATKCNMTPVGPQLWVYTGGSADKDVEFQLDIAIPVSGEGKSEKFETKELPEFKCASVMHRGSWDNFGDTYQKLVGEVMANGLKMSGVFREVYLNVDFADPSENLTEVQAGII